MRRCSTFSIYEGIITVLIAAFEINESNAIAPSCPSPSRNLSCFRVLSNFPPGFSFCFIEVRFPVFKYKVVPIPPCIEV